MTDFTTRSAFEAKTHELFADESLLEWSPSKAVVASVFRAMYSSAIPADRVSAIGRAMHSLVEFDAKPTLTKLVKAKVLRSRVSQDKRLYEVNY